MAENNNTVVENNVNGEMKNNNGDIYPLTLLSEELKNDDTEIRIKSMRKIKIVAQALGCERTRLELLPFLKQCTDDEDEILVTLSSELGNNFVPLVGGPMHAACLLDPLEALAATEETVVRDKATESINSIVTLMTDATETMVPLLKRLTEGDWFTSRVSACALFAVAYSRVKMPAHRAQLREMFQTLCGDDTPMVRRAAASNLGKFAANIEKDFVMSVILPLFKTLGMDDQDSVRLLAIENSSKIGALLSEEENRTHILPLVQSSLEDRSWRVRFSIAKDFSPISQAMGPKLTKEELLHHFVTLLQDGEAEVRAAASKNISSYVDIVGPQEFIAHVLDTIIILSSDAAPNVRGAVSIAVMELAPKLGHSATKDKLFPLYLAFLQDDVVDVRLNILRRMALIAEWAPGMEHTIIPAIVDLSRDLQWRVRDAVISTFPVLATNLGADYFKDHFLSIFLAAFNDTVGQVRYSANGVLEGLLVAVGSEWILEHVLPKLTQIYTTSVIYQERVNVLHAVKNLSCANASGALLHETAQFALRGARDKVPNVRVVACLILDELIKHAEDSVKSQIIPALAELQKDSDSDVNYYANVALEAAG